MFSTASTASSSVTQAGSWFAPTWTWTKPSWPQPELSIGRELEALDRSHRCWDIKGPVLELATKIYGAVHRELDLRAEYLVERERIWKPVLFRMYMTGRRKEEANPTLLFSCSREQPRKRAKEVVKESGILREHPAVRLAHSKRLPEAPTPFRILVGPMNKIATEGGGLFGEVYCISPVDRTCGVPVFVRRKDGSFRKATIGGIVQLGDTYYGLTVAHTFVDDGFESAEDSDDDFCDMECSFDSDDDNSSENPRERVAGHPTYESGSHGSREFISFRTATLSKALQYIDQDQARSSIVGNLYQYSPHTGLDWALIEIDNSRVDPKTCNAIKLTNEYEERTLWPRALVVTGPAERQVLAITGDKGVIQGSLSQNPIYMRTAHTRGFQELWTIDMTSVLVEGDCGSWIVDRENGQLYGQIVAGHPGSGVGYIIPASQIFESVWQTLGDALTLPCGSSGQRSESVVETQRDFMPNRGDPDELGRYPRDIVYAYAHPEPPPQPIIIRQRAGEPHHRVVQEAPQPPPLALQHEITRHQNTAGLATAGLATAGLATAGLATAARAAVQFYVKGQRDEEEQAQTERARRGRERSRSRARSTGVYSDPGVDPELGIVQHGTEPVYTHQRTSYRSYDYDPAVAASGAAYSTSRSRGHLYSGRNSSSSDEHRSRSRSRGRDNAGAAVATGGAALGVLQNKKRGAERLEHESVPRRDELEHSRSRSRSRSTSSIKKSLSKRLSKFTPKDASSQGEGRQPSGIGQLYEVLNDKAIARVLQRNEKDARRSERRDHTPLDPARPVYTRMARRHLSLETLRVHSIDYDIDSADPDYVLIKRWVPEEVQEELWEHTRRIRSSSPQDGGRGRKLPKLKAPEKDQASDRKQNERNRTISVFEERPPAPPLAQQPLAYDPAPARPAEALPADWIAHEDESSRKFYYIHLPTQAVQWEIPAPGSSQASLPPVYDYHSEHAGFDSQEHAAAPLQPAATVEIHDSPLDDDLEGAIERSKSDFQRPPKTLESTKLRGSKSKASKSSGKVSSDASEIGSETSTAKKAKDANTSPLLKFLAGGKRR